MSLGGFERIKQGAHQDVYCNGTRHVELTGELKTRNPVDIRVIACNCPRPSQPEKVPA